MTIVYIFDSIARVGGTERVLVDKMNYIADVFGYEVYLITSCQGQHPFSFPLSSKVVHIDVDAKYYLQYKYKFVKRLIVAYKIRRKLIKELQRCVTQIKPDIIIGTCYYVPNVICKIKTSAKIIIESHSAKYHFKGEYGLKRGLIKGLLAERIRRRHLRIVEKLCDCLVVLTNGDRHDWNIEDARVAVIPNSMTKQSYQASECSAHRVICAVRLDWQKGLDMMVDAWNKVHTAHEDWKLDIFGEGEEYANINSRISKLGLDSSIHIKPFTKDIYAEYLGSSIYALSSRCEGFPLVLIEAMECGVPCVSFDCPYGPASIISHKEDGLLVENGNVEALADAICWMIEHDDERKEMGRKAKENVKRFNPDVVMTQWDKLFKKIMSK